MGYNHGTPTEPPGDSDDSPASTEFVQQELDAQNLGEHNDVSITSNEWDGLYNNGTNWTDLGDAFHGHYARVYKTSTQNIGNATFTAMGWGTTASGDLSGVTLSTSGEYLQVNEAGIYLVVGQIRWASNATGTRIASIYTAQAGTPTTYTATAYNYERAVSGLRTYQQVVTWASAPAGQRFRLYGYQNSGGTIAAEAGSNSTWMGIALVRRIGIV